MHRRETILQLDVIGKVLEIYLGDTFCFSVTDEQLTNQSYEEHFCRVQNGCSEQERREMRPMIDDVGSMCVS